MAIDEPASAPPDEPPEQPRSPDIGTVLVLIHGIIAAIVAAYIETESKVITVLAGGTALLLAVLFICKK